MGRFLWATVASVPVYFAGLFALSAWTVYSRGRYNPSGVNSFEPWPAGKSYLQAVWDLASGLFAESWYLGIPITAAILVLVVFALKRFKPSPRRSF